MTHIIAFKHLENGKRLVFFYHRKEKVSDFATFHLTFCQLFSSLSVLSEVSIVYDYVATELSDVDMSRYAFCRHNCR